MNRRTVRKGLGIALPLSIASAIVGLSLQGCSSDSGGGTPSGTGNVQFVVVPEDSVPEGLEPGTDAEQVKDGWKVTYDRFLVSIGNLRAQRSDTGAEVVSGDTSYVLDLKNAPTTGYVVAEFNGIAAARYDKFGFSLPNAKAGAKLMAPTSQADLDFMVKEGLSVYFEGAIEKGAEKYTFKWGFKAGTAFADCATEDGQPGFAVPSGGTVQVKPTIHGDHWFFTNVTQGAEVTERRAEWIKACDKDGNKDVTLAELKTCDLATAMPQKPNGPYDLTAVKDQDGDGKITVFDYVDSQARTLGDFQGDGECPTRSPAP
ncbi:MAG: hypothetical protein IPK71_17790 [Myxococcales bacterium]|nr:hypothetical protein [Myxococcales bacterium]